MGKCTLCPRRCGVDRSVKSGFCDMGESPRIARAAVALGKGARAIHQSGKWFTDDNIDGLLMDRHLAKKARRSGKHHLKDPAKRTEEDDKRFAESFEQLIQEALYETTHRA